MKYLLPIVVLVLILTSCFKPDFKDFPENEHVEPIDSIDLTQSFVGNIWEFKIIDSLVFILDIKDEYPFHIYDIKNKEHVKNFGKRGKGPFEMTTPSNFCLSTDRNYIFVCDLNKIHVFNVDSILQNDDYLGEDVIKLPKQIEYAARLQAINKSELVVFGLYENNRLAFMKINGEFIKTNGKVERNSRVGSDRHYNFLQDGTISSNSETGKIVLVGLRADRLEIFNDNGDIIKKIYGPIGFKEEYRVWDDGESMEILNPYTSLHAYYDVYASDNFIYGLYSGCKFEVYEAYAEHLYPTSVHILNYEGEPIKRLYLDKHYSKIEVFESQNKLIAKDNANVDYLYVFDLE